MKFSDLRHIYAREGVTFANVTVTTWFFFHKRKSVYRTDNNLYWRFLDTGTPVPNCQVSDLYSAYRAREVQ